MKRKRWEYAMYKGDKLLAFGTREKICEQLNIKRKTFEYFRSNAYKERIKNRNAKNYRYIIRIN